MSLLIPKCLECGTPTEIVSGKRIYPHRPDLFSKSFWLCQCGAYCGCHPGTKEPLGYPCGPITRKARNAAHAAFDPIWKGKSMPRKAAYGWLSEAIGIPRERCHIGMMTADEAQRVVEACNAREAA